MNDVFDRTRQFNPKPSKYIIYILDDH